MRKTEFSFLIFLSVFAISFIVPYFIRPQQYFTKDNIVKFTITAENGAISYAEVKIKDVLTRGSGTSIFAHDNRLNDQHKSTFQYRLHFYNDTINWCVDALNHLNIPVAYSSNFIVSLRTDSLVYPYTMEIGDTLPSASASELIYGTGNNERFVIVNHRKVVAIENVVVGTETFQAVRIAATMRKGSVTDYGALGKIPSEQTYDFIEWFVPSKGVVKSELKSKTGVMTTILQ